MKISGDKSAPGYISEKNETQGRVSKNPKSASAKSAQVALTADELELTNKKAPALTPVRDTVENATSVDFEVTEMFKQELAAINNYIRSNPAEALSAQANLKSETVARLIG